MTTTTFLQIKPDYYESKEECIKETKMKIQTNAKYEKFNQRQFTAGDEEQFQEYRDPTNGQVCIPDINLDKNLFKDFNLDISEKYKDVETEDVLHTFRYIFNKFKKGIFIKIKEGKLSVFLPFSKFDFTNEWSDKIKVDPKKYSSVNDFLMQVSETQGYKFISSKVHQNISKWYGNNCLMRYEKPISEGDSNVSNVKNMLEELCANREIPDIEFFINRRDFPLLTKNGTEPYDGIWGSENVPLVSHKYEKYIPIFSMSKTDRYADMLNPTWDDWARIQKDIWFPNTCKDYDSDFSTPWDEKKDLAVFRGGSTGCGTTFNDNMRLKIAKMSVEYPEYLDAGITNWNVRPRKNKNSEYIQTIIPKDLDIELVSRLSPEEQSKYKYVVHIQGHVSAFRLSTELNMGSVILYVENPWKIWYSDMLKPYIHYVPVKEDLSDLLDRIKWCRKHQKECKEISKNAREFYNTYLQKDGVLDYMQKSIVEIKNKMGMYFYNSQTPVKAVINDIECKTEKWTPHFFPSSTDFSIYKIPNMGRSYGLLQGIKWVIDFLGDITVEMSNPVGEIFRNKTNIIKKYSLAGFPLVIKSTTEPQKHLEYKHEGFIGSKVLNNLTKEIPNFAYVFEQVKAKVIMEYIKGESLEEYISSNSFKIDEYILIIAQLCLALKIAQDKYGFVHWNLNPSNIMLQRFSSPKSFDYAVSLDEIYRVNTTVIPVIINYGKAHVVHNNIHHGFINPYKFSSIQDITKILLTSVNQIVINQRLEKSDFTKLITLSNFISGTTYRKEEFHSAKDLLQFTSGVKKSTVCDMGDLEEKDCMDLLKYLITIKPLPIIKTSNYINSLNKGNPQQVFEYIFSPDKKRRLKTYESVFSRLMNSTIPQPRSKFFMYYAAQSIETNIKSVWSNFKKFLEKEGMSIFYYEKIYNNVISFLRRVYIPKIKDMEHNKISWKQYEYKNVKEYDESIFLSPKKVSKSIVSYKDENFRQDIMSVILHRGEFEMTDVDREFYTKELSGYINYVKDNLIKAADAKTLVVISDLLYKQDAKYLEEKLKVETGNCENAKKINKEYLKVLESIKKYNK